MKPMTLEEVHSVLYDILVDIHEFCVDNNIKYSLAGGTLLGAIRHNGFIPWDDDLDIQMARPEYDRFIYLYKSKRGYKLFSREIEGCEDVCIAFSRVCEMNLTYVDVGTNPWQKSPTGIWVDVVPIDGAPDDKQRAMRKIRKMYLFWWMTQIVRANLPIEAKYLGNPSKRIKSFIKKFLSLLIPNDIVSRYISMCKEYDYDTNDYLANYSTMQNKYREWQPKATMDSYLLHRFEKNDFYIMEGYETSLSSLYDDYMKLPPVEKQVAHIDNTYYWR